MLSRLANVLEITGADKGTLKVKLLLREVIVLYEPLPALDAVTTQVVADEAKSEFPLIEHPVPVT